MDTGSQARSRRVTDWLLVGLLIAIVAGLLLMLLADEQLLLGKAKQTVARKSGQVLESVRNASVPGLVTVPQAPPGGFTPQARLGFVNGDQWEPAIAADRFGHVYVLYAQYYGVPGCDTCASPTQILQVSNDSGATWGVPRVVLANSSGQWDSQIVVDPADGQTVYASWLQNSKSDIVVAKSTDFGVTWNIVVADGINAGGDKPILIVNGPDVYVAYNHANTIWLSSSHDGGQTFSHWSDRVGNLGWSLPASATITPDGTVYFSWNGYKKSGNTTGDVNLYLSKSTDGGANWTIINVDKSGAPPPCPEYSCGWAYLGPQIVIASDNTGTLYTLYHASDVAGGPERMYFRKSTDGGASWTPRVEVSTAPAGKHHAFPAMWASGNGEVRIGWIDNRNTASDGTPAWNVWYRTSANGGGSWSAETDLSTYVSGFSYIFPEGFRFPFGDYWEMDVDGAGNTHLVFGEGYSYDSPGSIWYVNGK